MKIPHEHVFTRMSELRYVSTRRRPMYGGGVRGGVTTYRKHVCVFCGAEDWREESE